MKKMMAQKNPEPSPESSPQATIFEIQVKGNLIPRWEEWFEGLTAETLENDEIRLSGPVADQAALHGLLIKLRDLNMELISVRKLISDLQSKQRSIQKRRNIMNNQKSFTRTAGLFIGLAVAGITIAVAAQVVPEDFARTVMIAIGSAVFGAGLTFFLVRWSSLFDK